MLYVQFVGHSLCLLRDFYIQVLTSDLHLAAEPWFRLFNDANEILRKALISRRYSLAMAMEKFVIKPFF